MSLRSLLFPSVDPSLTASTPEARRLQNEARLSSIRQLILIDGISSQDISLRPLIWKLLLGLNKKLSLSPETYYKFCNGKGPSVMFQKIKNDTFRTLKTDMEFMERVRETVLVRMLEGVVWHRLDTYPQNSQIHETPYIQGMNVLCAPFLYVMPSELEAFNCFNVFIERLAPRYVSPGLEGVHDGLKLLDKCLKILDPQLYSHLKKKNLSAELYAFPSVLTLCACTPPLTQVLHLWDFLLSFGVHLNILCIIAQMFLKRDELLASHSPMKLLRQFPPFETRQIIPLCCHFIEELPERLYDEIVRHTWDDSLEIED